MDAENIEFLALLEASGWTQAETARRLQLYPATISQYKHGSTKPSWQVLELFKFILAAEKPGVLTVAADNVKGDAPLWEREVIRDLRWLNDADRNRAIKILRAFIDGLPVPPKAPKANLSPRVKKAADRLVEDCARRAKEKERTE